MATEEDSTEEIVERCARLLLSDSSKALIGTTNFFEKLSNNRNPRSPSSENRLSCLLQELLAFKRGAVVDHLLQQIELSSPDLDGSKDVGLRRLYLCKMIVALSENEAVAKYCVKEKQKARNIARALLDAQAHLLQVIPGQLRGKGCPLDQSLGVNEQGGEKYVYLNLAVENIKGFANFCYASKTFRLALQASDDFFPGLERLLARSTTKHASAQLLEKTVKSFLSLMQAVCRFEDSQDWAVDKRIIRIHAELNRLLMMDGVTESFVGDFQTVAEVVGGLQCPTSRDMRKRLAASGDELRQFDRRIRDTRDPRSAKKLREQWLETAKADVLPAMTPLLGASLGRMPGLPPGLVQDAVEEAAKALRCKKGGSGSAPIVCSWERCNIGSVVQAGRPFSKCANCSLAFYCSKEHQKLHWGIHKKQCRAQTSD